MNLKSLIETKKFDYVNPNITEEKFPLPARLPTEKTEYKLFKLDKEMTSKEVVKEIQEKGYTPANIYELLSWRDWNEEDLVIALGSVAEVDGDRSVTYLGGSDTGRGLHLYWWDDRWFRNYRFLAARNSSQTLEIKTSENNY